MKVLLVGSGGREHALAWKLVQSPRLGKLYIAPGNAGTAACGENVPIHAGDIPGLVAFARQAAIDLVVVGPEVPLTLGLADELFAVGIKVFGPSRAAAQIEGSKVFAKDFMVRHGIPTAASTTFTSFEEASQYLENIPYSFVIKASGLAAGKGVILPESLAEARATLHAMLVEGVFSDAGKQVIIEEKLEGEEVSLLAFSDGKNVLPMPPAQDHKRLLDGDCGPNTGGMGAYAPAPVCPPALVESLTQSVLQPTIDGMWAEGTPFTGVLYAGLMLTGQGPRVLEFNCRFGDPETQAILPLLESDLLEILSACANGRLEQIKIHWKSGACACVVLASENYPSSSKSGIPILGLDQKIENSMVFHAGTRLDGGRIVTNGGRVLNVTAWDQDLPSALSRVYHAIEPVSFQGMQYRKDIGYRAFKINDVQQNAAYFKAGVDIDAGNRAVELMSAAVRSTYTADVLAGIGAFGGLFDAKKLKTLRRPVLVASTDGVGTKVKLAAQAGHYRSIGIDIVNHCINDILVQGARPLFFLDYFATSKLKPEIVADIVDGIAEACRAAGCVVIGGETAEMPDVYAPGEFDLAGTIVGLVERPQIMPRPGIKKGDLLIGLSSSGPHTNGYSLIRKVFADVPLDTRFPELGMTLGDALLQPHRSYLNLLEPMLAEQDSPIKALAHITGGGFIENIPRILPEKTGAILRLGSWPVPPLFKLIQQRGQIPDLEMARVFNLGIGMVVIANPADLSLIQRKLKEPCWVIGEIVPGEKKVTLI